MSATYNDFRVHLSTSTPGRVSTAQGKGAVASVSKQATELAIAVLRSGGNAFDAAFSLAFSLCVFHPQAGNIGGGGYLLFKVTNERQPKVFNYREQSPARATREAFLLPDGSPDPNKTAYGPTSVCVPGTVKAFFALQRRYGKLNAKNLLIAIARRAEDGALVTQYEADCLNRLAPKLKASPESARVYTKYDPFSPGDILKNMHLARTLKVLAKEGETAFYRGRIAEQIIGDLSANGGFLEAADLANYTIREVAPVGIDIRGKRVWTVPPEAGGALLIEILAILDRDEFYRLRPGGPDYHHYLAQAAKIAFIDRLDYLGDIPLDTNMVYRGIFDRANAEKRYRFIDGTKDTGTEVLLHRLRSEDPTVVADKNHGASDDTTHFSVVDAEGNAVSNSYTMNLRYGSKWSVEGAGFLLNGSMDSFSFVEGKENYFGVIGSKPNLFGPGKRPASNMAPVLVEDGDRVEMVLGTPGGPTIPTTLAFVLIATIVHGMSPEEAVQKSRLHHQGWPDALSHEAAPLDPELLSGLSARGYAIQNKDELIGDVHGVFAVGDEYRAVSDYRREGYALAYTLKK